MRKLRLKPEDSAKLRPQEEIDKLVECFLLHGIIATPQQVVILWGKISEKIYGVDWVRVDVSQSRESLWLILQGNRFFWQVETDV